MHTGSVLWDRGFASWLQFSLKGLGCSFVLLYPSSNDFTRTINFSFSQHQHVLFLDLFHVAHLTDVVPGERETESGRHARKSATARERERVREQNTPRVKKWHRTTPHARPFTVREPMDACMAMSLRHRVPTSHRHTVVGLLDLR